MYYRNIVGIEKDYSEAQFNKLFESFNCVKTFNFFITYTSAHTQFVLDLSFRSAVSIENSKTPSDLSKEKREREQKTTPNGT